MTNEQAVQRFTEFLNARQQAPLDDRDIREHVLSLAKGNVGIGLVSDVLRDRFGANLPNIFPDLKPVDREGFADNDNYLMHGTVHHDPAHSHKGALQLLGEMPQDGNLVLMETGFLATTHSWIHASKEKNPAYACLGYVYDDIAHYFMADYPNRIIQKLNSDDTPTPADIERAHGLIQRIVTQRISKYNAQPMTKIAMTTDYPRRVLVCDQAYADASTHYGKIGDDDFEQMLEAAIAENPDAEILVKTHPDSVWEQGKRAGYYAHLTSSGRVRLLRDPVNPYVLFDHVDTVYVGTSQMGFEALMAGKKVVTFGVPFYAGWGLTDDRQQVRFRNRSRSLPEIFHYFYIWYTIYHLPGQKAPAEIEDVLDYIDRYRPFPMISENADTETTPIVSIIIPVYGVERYIRECLESVQAQTLRNIEIIPINDASPDGSQAIIDSLASGDQRIKPIVLAENIGQGFARNRGLEAATGKYIWFIDSDDWLVDPEFLENTVRAAERNGSDMTRAKKAGEALYDTNDNLTTIRPDVTEEHFTTDVEATTYRDNPDILHSRHFCLWLYKTQFLQDNDIRFVTTQWEERAFLLKALLRAKTISLTTNHSFMYRIRSDSTARRPKDMEDVERLLQNFEQICSLLKDHGTDNRQNSLREHLDFQLSHFLHILIFGFWYRTLKESGADPEPYFERVASALDRVDFRASDLTDQPEVMRKNIYNQGVYRVIVATLRARRFDWLTVAIQNQAVDQVILHQELMQKPRDQHQSDLQSAISTYARNELVLRAPISGSPELYSKPRIILHIGSTKTGSTYIQNMLEGNRPALLRQGIWFPEVGLYWQKNRPRKQAGHGAFAAAANQGNRTLLDYIESGLALHRGHIHTVILSSEAFFLNPTSENLATYFQDYLCEMVVYLRRQDEWASSQYAEFVSGGAVGRVSSSFENWVNQRRTQNWLDYENLAVRWERVLPKDRIHVRRYLKQWQSDWDVMRDLADTISLPQLIDLPKPDSSRANEASLSSAHIELFRHYNEKPFPNQEAYFAFVEDATNAITAWRRSRQLEMPRAWFSSENMTDVQSSNEYIRRHFFPDLTVDLFPPAKSSSVESAIYDQELILIRQAYERRAENGVSAKKRKRKDVVPYGVFGWRLWLLTPVLSRFYAAKATTDRLNEFKREPLTFSNLHWAGPRPRMAKLLYPNANTMGPGKIFTVFVPMVKQLVKAKKDPALLKDFERNPVLFVRKIRNPLFRMIGRILFPVGELR